jgi:hypothetical protein
VKIRRRQLRYDVVFLDTFLDENTLLKLYGATNVMLLPYLNMQQISSGILADTLGSGRVAVTTKFRYAGVATRTTRARRADFGRYPRRLVDPGVLPTDGPAMTSRLADAAPAHGKAGPPAGYQMRWNTPSAAPVSISSATRRIVTGRDLSSSRNPPPRHPPSPHSDPPPPKP